MQDEELNNEDIRKREEIANRRIFQLTNRMYNLSSELLNDYPAVCCAGVNCEYPHGQLLFYELDTNAEYVQQ